MMQGMGTRCPFLALMPIRGKTMNGRDLSVFRNEILKHAQGNLDISQQDAAKGKVNVSAPTIAGVLFAIADAIAAVQKSRIEDGNERLEALNRLYDKENGNG
jgi:hypothetical protein